MTDENRSTEKSKLALAIARGQSITKWAERNQVPLRTAYRWSADLEVRRAVQAWRRQTLNRAVGRMAGLALAAVDGIHKIAENAASESVQLSAWRALMADGISLAKFSDLESRMLEIEEMLDERAAPSTAESCYDGQGTASRG